MSPPALEPGARVVIVGAGHAGVHLADALRDGGFRGPVTLLGREDTLPYQRPPVSKELLLEATASVPLLRAEQFYADRAVTLVRDGEVIAIDRAARLVHTAGGGTHGYDHLVLATGGRPRPLPLPGGDAVLHLHTPADAATVRAALPVARSLLVIGAGFIGLELAAAARTHDVRTTVLDAADRVLARSVSGEGSAHVAAVHRAAGTAIHLGAHVVGLCRTGARVTGVQLADGRRTESDLVVAGIGSVAADEAAAAAGLAVEGGVVVDHTLATTDPHVSAIGDCTRFTSPWASAPLRLESVQNAVDQARHLATRLLTGTASPYRAVPWFWSRQGPLRLTIAGLPDPTLQVVRRGDGDRFSLYGFADTQLRCVESFNRQADHLAARRMLGTGLLPTPEMVADPGFDLVEFSRSVPPDGDDGGATGRGPV